MRGPFFAVDLFAGCGGLTQGLRDAGFHVFAAIENDSYAANVYGLNHPGAHIYRGDIQDLDPTTIKNDFPAETSPLHLLAACPPCQGFSSLRRKNKKRSVFDKRNQLILEFVRFVEELRPLCIMLENVPWLENYHLYKKAVRRLRSLGYELTDAVLDVADYGVPQHRDRLILLGSRLEKTSLARPYWRKRTVRDEIGDLPTPKNSRDALHRLTMQHTPKISELIRNIPRNGGSRKSLPKRFHLKCHQNKKAGFCDVYGRLRWSDQSVTITGGCLNPSKGRFLHPTQNRAITPREAALLQTFPRRYRFLSDDFEMPKDVLALLIGNALPPKFSAAHSRQLLKHIKANALKAGASALCDIAL